MSASITGLENLLKQLKRYEVEVNQRVQEETEKTAEAIAKDAEQLAPVASGRLRESIQVVRSENGSYSVKTDAEYASYVELGTRLIQARPFLFPAYLANVNIYLNNLKIAINSIK